MDDLGQQEAAVLALIRENPFAGQQEIADMLGLARSTVAAHVTQLVQKGYILGRGYVLPEPSRAVAIGGAVFDRKYRARTKIVLETSNPVDGLRSFGGVARNVAENLALLGTPVSFISMIGDDETGAALLAQLRERGIDVSQVVVTRERPTAEYAAVLDPAGDLVLGLADMGIFDLFQPAHLDRAWSHIASASLVFADCNLPGETLTHLVTRRQGARFRLAVDAVSTHKVTRLPEDLNGIDLLFMNLDEANTLLGRRGADGLADAAEAASLLQQKGAREAVVTMGARGMAVAGAEGSRTFPAIAAQPVDMTGAGDAMIAGTLHGLLSSEDTYAAARSGALLGALTTESAASVHPELSQRFLDAHRHRLSGGKD
jgi:pseudouridine kinase